MDKVVKGILEFPSAYTGDLLSEVNKQVDNILYSKLHTAACEAMRQGHIELYCILNKLDAGNAQVVMDEANKAGYEITLERPDYEFTCDANIFKAIVEVEKIKVVVKKILIEV